MIENIKVFRIHLAKSNNTFLYFIHTTNKQITTNTQLKSNHPLYPFDKQITMDIIFQSNDSMYQSVETYRISNF
jgi:hypothetical protein